MEELEVHHLTVGTEVSAKYRGAFCEAKIKSVKKNVVFRVTCKKDGKNHSITEESMKGVLKVGSTVEVQFPEMPGWNEGVINAAKDKSVYTVEFDDGDVRTLSRGSLCLQGVRHFAESETLDHLPLTDPENFGTPVLSSKRKTKRKAPHDVDSDDQKSPDREPSNKRRSFASKSGVSRDEEIDSVSEEEKRKKWLSDSLMGKLVLVEPTDKRKHWYPAVCVNPLSLDDVDDMQDDQVVVRSFKNGKIMKVHRCEQLTSHNAPSKVEQSWKDVLENSFSWEKNGTIPDVWKLDIKDILNDEERESLRRNKAGDEEKKSNEFLEQLYKFMEDRGTPMNKTPVLGYKDLDLFLLYNLVQAKGGFHSITLSSDWKEIYADLGIPKLTQAAGHHVKMAYIKYLLSFEEYLVSFHQPHVKTPNKQAQRSNIASKSKERVLKTSISTDRISPLPRCDDDNDPTLRRRTSRRRNKVESENKQDSDVDDATSSTGSEVSVTKGKADLGDAIKQQQKVPERRRSQIGFGGRRKNASYKIGDLLKVKYGRDSFKLYKAKVVDVEREDGKDIQYYVHYAGWNSRHDEWIKPWRVHCVVNDKTNSQNSSIPPSRSVQRRSKTPTLTDEKKTSENVNSSSSSDHERSKTSLSKDGDAQRESPQTPENKSNLTKVELGKRKLNRIRRRSTSSSTQSIAVNVSPESKRAGSVEKVMNRTAVVCIEQEREDSMMNADKVLGRSGVHAGVFPPSRRTSGRRSKSPAYLKESTLYGLTKRKRTNSCASVSESVTHHESIQDSDDLSSETSSRSTESITSEMNHEPAPPEWPKLEKNSTKTSNPTITSMEDKDENNVTLTQIKEETDESCDKTSYDAPVCAKEDDELTTNIEIDDIKEEAITEVKKETVENSTTCNSKEITITDEAEHDKHNNSEECSYEATTDEPSDDKVEDATNMNNTKVPDTSVPPIAPQIQPPVPCADVVPLPIAEPVPSNSQVLLENTPPTTPESPPQHAEHESNGALINGESRTSSLSGGEIHHASSSSDHTTNKEHVSTESTSNNSASSQPQKVKNRTNIGRRNSKNNNNKLRSKSVGESESEDENSKAKHTKSRKRPKKRVKPDPPSAPTPITFEEMRNLPPEEKIRKIQNHLTEMRKIYQQLKQEVSSIDRKRKRAKRREQEGRSKMQALEQMPPEKKSTPPSPSKRNGAVDSSNYVVAEAASALNANSSCP